MKRFSNNEINYPLKELLKKNQSTFNFQMSKQKNLTSRELKDN